VEVMAGSPQFDFWDTEAMAREVLHLLEDEAYRRQVIAQQVSSINQVTWKKAAKKVEQIYQTLSSKTKRKKRVTATTKSRRTRKK
jgi:glycosyltransferase involved in cell wall biosynthesis